MVMVVVEEDWEKAFNKDLLPLLLKGESPLILFSSGCVTVRFFTDVPFETMRYTTRMITLSNTIKLTHL
jgi:hypothetical protein